jgi:sugar lactone lactonase YvrE
VKNLTNCVFGGRYKNELYVTSARLFLKKEDLKENNLSGSLFKIKLQTKGKKSRNYGYIL